MTNIILALITVIGILAVGIYHMHKKVVSLEDSYKETSLALSKSNHDSYLWLQERNRYMKELSVVRAENERYENRNAALENGIAKLVRADSVDDFLQALHVSEIEYGQLIQESESYRNTMECIMANIKAVVVFSDVDAHAFRYIDGKYQVLECWSEDIPVDELPWSEEENGCLLTSFFLTTINKNRDKYKVIIKI